MVEKFQIVFQSKNNMEDRIFQLELDMGHIKADMDELRDIVIALSYTLNDIDKKITKYLDGQSKE